MSHNLDLIKKKYSEKVLRKNSHLFDSFDWIWLSEFQKLPESFIKEFKNKVYWPWISIHQKLSKKLMMEFINLINIECLEYNEKIPLEDKKEIIAYKLLVG